MLRLPLFIAVAAIAVAVALSLTATVGARTETVMGNSVDPRFIPATVNIAVGDSVEWTNITGNHTVTSSSSNWSQSFTVDTTFVFTAAGTYSYNCLIHGPSMNGQVVVAGIDGPPGTPTGTSSTPTATSSTPTATPATPTAAPTTSASTGALFALLTGASENPPTTSTGTGSVTLTFDAAAGTVTGTWNATGLSSNLAAGHIHRGAPSENGPIVVPFTNIPGAGGSFSTSNAADAGLIGEILANPGGFYVNLHTANNPGGEVRGALQVPASCGTGALGASLLPSSEVPPKGAGATGDVTFAVDRAAGTITGSWNVSGASGNIAAGHIHQNAAGSNGPVVVPFTALPPAGGRFATTTAVAPQLIANLLANPAAFYVNLHTALNPSGETRGQLGCVASGRSVRLPLQARNASAS